MEVNIARTNKKRKGEVSTARTNEKRKGEVSKASIINE
jgi:hypothetical protein